jgi:CDGSH-type Zn-finger protein
VSVVTPLIRIVLGGPMLVEGVSLGRLRRAGDSWQIDEVTAERTYALCRCGTAEAMPFCDREPPYGCFEEPTIDAQEPGPFRWDVPDPEGSPAVALKPNGPLRVTGEVDVTYGEEPVTQRDRTSLCRCGASRCQPLCDSSHKIVGFQG